MIRRCATVPTAASGQIPTAQHQGRQFCRRPFVALPAGPVVARPTLAPPLFFSASTRCGARLAWTEFNSAFTLGGGSGCGFAAENFGDDPDWPPPCRRAGTPGTRIGTGIRPSSGWTSTYTSPARAEYLDGNRRRVHQRKDFVRPDWFVLLHSVVRHATMGLEGLVVVTGQFDFRPLLPDVPGASTPSPPSWLSGQVAVQRAAQFRADLQTSIPRVRLPLHIIADTRNLVRGAPAGKPGTHRGQTGWAIWRCAPARPHRSGSTFTTLPVTSANEARDTNNEQDD